MPRLELWRCQLAMWLDSLSYRIGDLAEWVEPSSEAWKRYDAWAEKRGYHDWLKKGDGDAVK
jgi:hypothetical protein